jgi:mono/diheme cytochrome c family protein
MGRGWRPIVAGGLVAAATFALAQAQVFEPSASAGEQAAGDVSRGEAVFARECASCHGEGGMGGGVGPALFETGLEAGEVSIVVQQGRGVMPAGLVSGQEFADVVAYVESISRPAQ